VSDKSLAQLHEFWHSCRLSDAAWARARRLFDRYWQLIAARNDRAGLMGRVTEEDFHLKHLADSLAILAACPELRVGAVNLADVGCGAGLPGIVLAVALPELRVTAIESNHAKARFVALASAELGLSDRVEVICQRSRELAGDPRYEGRFGVITARAVAAADKIMRDTRRLLAPGGSILLYKTPAAVAKEMPLAAREAGKHGLSVQAHEPVALPGGAGARQFLRITRRV